MAQIPIFIKPNIPIQKNPIRFNLNLPPPPSFQIPKKNITPNLNIFSLDNLSIDNQVLSSSLLKNIEEKLNNSKNIQESNQNQTSLSTDLNLKNQDEKKDKLYNHTKIHENMIKYQEDFKKTYKIKIDHFLNEQFAEHLYNHIIRIPDNQLYIACGIRNTKYEKKLTPQNAKRNQDNINEANKTFGKGEFAYVFHRGMNNVVGEITQMEMIMRTILNSNEFKGLLSELTGLEITNLNTMFLSKYKSGHFLSPHSDKGNGKIAFVINLTKNWMPQYGGNLHFLSEDRKSIVETWTPAFNNMVIFYVPPDLQENIGLPHFVGHVNPGIKLSRYAITGWYS